MTEKVVIIGSGPAGWSAAIYAARANLQPLVFEGTPKPDMIPLGQLAFTTEVENYPGFPVGNVRAFIESAVDTDRHYNLPPVPTGHMKNGQPYYAVQGVELVELMKQQALNFGTRVVSDDIVDVQVDGRPWQVIPEAGAPVAAHAVIVATGARANDLGLPSEEAFKNRGVSACAVCDGALPRFRQQPVAVVGGGDSAVEEADYLSHFASVVYLIHRRDQLRASKIMQERLFSNPKIAMVGNAQLEEVLGDDKSGVTGWLRGGAPATRNPDGSFTPLPVAGPGGKARLDCRGVFISIGHTPNTAFLHGKLALNEKGYIKWARAFRTATSVEGIFAAGDVADDYYRQAITSAGTGCMAALDAERYLAEKGL